MFLRYKNLWAGHPGHAHPASSPEKLATLPNGVATFIRWSPDATRLRFTVTDPSGGTLSSLWQISSTGGDLHRLFPIWGGSHPQECCGNWTADGKYFVFQATRGGITGIWAVREEMHDIVTTSERAGTKLVKYEEIADALIGRGVNINREDMYQDTALVPVEKSNISDL